MMILTRVDDLLNAGDVMVLATERAVDPACVRQFIEPFKVGAHI